MPLINKFSLLLNLIIFPIGSLFPNIFSAVFSVKTIVNGSVNAVLGFPFINLNEKISNTDESE